MKRSIIVALTSLAMLATVAAPALAQDYPPDAPECALEDTVVAPGTAVVVACVDWAPNSMVTAMLISEGQGQVLNSVRTDAQGALTEPFTIPADTAPGPHTLRMSGTNQRGQDTHVDLAITVVAADADPDRAGVVPTPGGDRGLPRTGTQVLMLVGTAAGLLVVGALAVVGARRRKSRRLSA